jgi:hypothetical protein
MNVVQSAEWELAKETEVVGEKLPQIPFVHHKSHMTLLLLEPGPPPWEPGDYLPELCHGHNNRFENSCCKRAAFSQTSLWGARDPFTSQIEYLWWTKWYRNGSFPITSVSLTNFYSIKWFKLINGHKIDNI